MRRIFSLLLLALMAANIPAAHALAETRPVALFYMVDTPDSMRSFLAHSKKIGLLVPAWYSVDANGLVSGGPNPTVLEVARKQHLPVMALIGNAGREQFHALLGNSVAQKAMIGFMIRESKKYGYAGFQIDFENISWTDRDALSAIVKQTADAMHAEGLQLTIATVPNAPGAAGRGGFAKWIYEYWRGAYDLKALAQSADLICLMTYDQHTRWTTPGPVAGWTWTMENLDYALKDVPKEKLSLGIPLYGYHWFAGAPIVQDKEERSNISAEYINAEDAVLLANAYKGSMQWDPVDHSTWFFFYRDQMREWIFYTDTRTFDDRYKLVQERGLQGFCSWVLGAEDPGIWNLLPDRR